MQRNHGLNRRAFLKSTGATAVLGAVGARSALASEVAATDVGPAAIGGAREEFDFDEIYDRRGSDCVKWDRAIEQFGPEIEVGMPAGIELSGADGSLDGEVAKVAALPVPDRMAALAPVFPHRIDIGLEEDVLFPAGLECRIVIELGTQAPVALFGMRWQ